ncbi:STAS domain-containing protein [Legionella sp. CNM-4043-24]|uniref:STAS domain-containing protein n=1 Tax=Legionella sp. CNM-4043-24 TaxID=3421646 RepID=UPI00403AE003
MSSAVFIPSNEMSFETVMSDRERLLAYSLELKTPVMILDLSQVEQCDSAGLAFLIEAKRLARDHHLECRIEGVTRAVQSLAEFCGVNGTLGLNT